MAETTQWEYRAVSIGSFWSMPKDEEIEAVLNEFGSEGWEVINIYAQEGSNKARVIMKRPLTGAVRRQRNWPG